MPLKPWKKLSESVVFRNPYWTYKRDAFELPSGKPGDYHYVHTDGSSMVVPSLREREGRRDLRGNGEAGAQGGGRLFRGEPASGGGVQSLQRSHRRDVPRLRSEESSVRGRGAGRDGGIRTPPAGARRSRGADPVGRHLGRDDDRSLGDRQAVKSTGCLHEKSPSPIQK